MRQTSKAVLLLISSACAGEVNPAFSLKASAPGAPTITNQGNTVTIGVATYAPGAFIVAGTTNAVTLAVDDTKSSAQTAVSCIQCIKSAASAGGALISVWCSAGWNYEYTDLPNATAYPTQLVAANTWQKDGVTAGAAVSTKGDLGQCCYGVTAFAAQVVLPVASTTANKAETNLFNKWTCPAKFATSFRAADQTMAASQTASNFAQSTNNWWCSDGTYNLSKTSDDTYATNGATANSWLGALAEWKSTAADAGNLIVLASDKRNELMYAACRQRKLVCGASHVEESSTASTMLRTIVKHANGFSSAEKCTWVMRSKTLAPTFKIYNAASATGVPLTANFEVVYSEWVEGWQLVAGTDYLSGYDGATAGTTATNQGGVVNPGLAGANWAKARKHNYVIGPDTDVTATNNAQTGGQAFVYTKSSLACAVTGSGTLTQTPTSCWDTTTKKRWFALDTSGVTAQNAQATQYDTNKAAFNTKAATYNTFLADLKKANETDAFAAFFSPPKKPAMVVRPAAPTMPAAYAGMEHWSGAKQQLFWNEYSTGFPAYNTDYILGNNAQASGGVGGWGHWTISRIAGAYNDANVNFISHSFGMLGTTQSATLDTGRSYIKNWGKDGFAGTTAANLKSSQAVSPLCRSVTGTAPTCLMVDAKPGTASVINTKYVYLNLSVWGAGTTLRSQAEYLSDKIDFNIQFYASSWADGKAYYAPLASTAGTTLTTPAAAQALAASAAAVVAVAAALY